MALQHNSSSSADTTDRECHMEPRKHQSEAQDSWIVATHRTTRRIASPPIRKLVVTRFRSKAVENPGEQSKGKDSSVAQKTHGRTELMTRSYATTAVSALTRRSSRWGLVNHENGVVFCRFSAAKNRSW